jgi:hypothetical protein
MAGARELGGHEVAPPDLVQQRGHGIRAQRLRIEPVAPNLCADLREQAVRVVVRACADEHRNAQRFDAATEVGEEAQRRLIGPVRIVDHDRQRRLVCEVRHEPVESVEQPQGRRLAVLGSTEEDRLGQLRCPLKESLTVDVMPNDGLEQLPHDTERERALEFRPAALQHAHPRSRSVRAGGAHKS